MVALIHSGAFVLDLTDGNIHHAWTTIDQVCPYGGGFGGLCFCLSFFNKNNVFQDPIRQTHPGGKSNPPNPRYHLVCNISRVQIWWLCRKVKYTPNTPYPPHCRLWCIVNAENAVKSNGNRCPGTDTAERHTVSRSLLAHYAREYARELSASLLSPARPRVKCLISERKEL